MRSPAIATAIAVFSVTLTAGCLRHIVADVPENVMSSPGAETWGVAWLKSHEGYAVTSTSKLNGHSSLHEMPTVILESGRSENWEWRVMTVPALDTQWKAFQAEQHTQKVEKEAQQSGNWLHTVLTWNLAFERAHRAATYLLGREPLALHATLLLLPDGVSYDSKITERRSDAVPLTLAFYWTKSNPTDFLGAVSTTMYEYQHLLVDDGIIAPMGDGLGNQTANDEARSQCWSDSTLLALIAGSSSHMEWKLSNAQAAAALLERSEQVSRTAENSGDDRSNDGGIPFSEAYMWGRFFEVQSIAAYFRVKNIPSTRVEAKDLTRISSVMSVCRAMTLAPADVTNGGYPTSQIKYAPYFPAQVSSVEVNP